MRASLILLIFVFNIIGEVLAQPKPVQYLSLKDGLSSLQVLDVVHDDQGFVWVATDLGLNRFASHTFKKYYRSDQMDGATVNSNEINKLLYDDGRLYIGTRSNGLNVLDLKTNIFSYFLHDPQRENTIATNDITDLKKGRDGAIWLATYHQGLQRFDVKTKTFKHFNKKNTPDLPENSIWNIAQDEKGLWYLGHVKNGLSILDCKTRKVKHITNNQFKRELASQRSEDFIL